MNDARTRGSRVGRALAIGLSAALGVGLFLSLGAVEGLDLSDIGPALGRIGLFGAAAVVATTVLHFALTAAKWRLVTEGYARIRGFGTSYLTYSAVGGLVAQVLPIQVATVVTRSLALRLHQKEPVARSAGLAVYEQLFDLIVPLAVLPGSFAALVGHASAEIGAALSLAGLVVAGGALAFLGGPTMRGAIAAGGRLPVVGARLRAVAEDADGRLDWLTARETVLRLYGISAIRYGNLLLRYAVVAVALDLPIGSAAIAFAFPLIVLAFALAFTPAALGVTEWGWIGLLGMAGIDAGVAGLFAAVSRIVHLVGVIVASALVFAWSAARNGAPRAPDDEPSPGPTESP